MSKASIDLQNKRIVIDTAMRVSPLKFEDLSPERAHIVAVALEQAFAAGYESALYALAAKIHNASNVRDLMDEAKLG